MSRYRHIREGITVEELVKECDKSRFWLCPRLVLTQKIDRHPFLQSMECSKHSIPDEIKKCKVACYFVESDLNCIVWENREIEPKLMEEFKYSLKVTEERSYPSCLM